ncbi:unnamed protein product [Fraxinus pennsylvanica]|uniref:Uncharacterized protein n=1 Tax=Fraxinus pennsylvanica TaxID=56036 RepID=A0AAD2DZD4_9LAMI|nr:unnamed protein product [Fraxinus pennsylvanica]
MPSQVRWSSMPRVPMLQDEEDNDLTETGSESIDISLSSEDNDGPDGRRRGPNHNTNGRPDESGRTPLTVGGNRFITPWASRAVSANLKSYLGGPYPTYSLVPVDIKKLSWERFQHEKLGKPPTASQLFERIHRRNKGEGDFVDNKSRIVYETYDNAINENMVQMLPHILKLTLKLSVKQVKVLISNLFSDEIQETSATLLPSNPPVLENGGENDTVFSQMYDYAKH